MRPRGPVALGLGGATLVAAWLFGSVPLVPVGVGLLAAGALATAWRRLVSSNVALEREVPGRQVEGVPLEIVLSVQGARRLVGRATAREHVGDLGDVEVPLRRGRGVLRLDHVPRGSYTVGPATLVLEDPLGLERVTIRTTASRQVLVRPRVVAIDALFAGGGDLALGGRGRLRRGHGGLEPYGIRDYREGEPLRSVHWTSTARRGVLTVRDVEDPTRDDVVVVLDGDQAGDVGVRGASSFDEATRAAAAIVYALARRGRRVRLVIHGAVTSTHRVGSTGGDWEAALDALAGARADAMVPVHAAVTGPRSALAGVAEAIVVTARPSPLLVRGLGRTTSVALVVVDAPTYGGGVRSTPEPALLRLAAGGGIVAVIRQGDDLGVVLSGGERERLGA